ncbi:PaaI family thioesterase [Janibacter sp. GXQ6167]|uniref:PaaI family thioesterase n=1 Tax=Janibacter sp. GXQ6167 TaxID=3240791 RepID=UPI0035241CD7
MTGGLIVSPFPVEDPSALAAQEQVYGELAESIRPLIDACVRTRVEPEELRAVAAEVRALTERLLATAQDTPLGLETSSDGRLRDHGNPAIGLRNPIAPPLHITYPERGRAECFFSLGAPYEGPPMHVHGGIVATVLDQVLGLLPAHIGRPGMTAYLNCTYRRPTPLGDLSCVAWVEEELGFKTLVRGELRDDQGRVTVEAEGLFVVPKWARQHLGTPVGDAGDFDPV